MLCLGVMVASASSCVAWRVFCGSVVKLKVELFFSLK